MACVGIIGGLSVAATVHYYERIAAACKARGVTPDLVFTHADVDFGQGLVRAGKLDELATYLVSFLDRMAHAGAEVMAIPAVTPHIAIDRVKKLTALTIVDIVETLGAELRAKKIRRVALFGTVFTIEGGLWGQLQRHAPEVEIVKPKPEEVAFAGAAYQRILDTQRSNDADAARFRALAAELQRRDGVEAILLAGTDLTVMFDETTAGFPAIDVARLHIDAIVERLAA